MSDIQKIVFLKRTVALASLMYLTEFRTGIVPRSCNDTAENTTHDGNFCDAPSRAERELDCQGFYLRATGNLVTVLIPLPWVPRNKVPWVPKPI